MVSLKRGNYCKGSSNVGTIWDIKVTLLCSSITGGELPGDMALRTISHFHTLEANDCMISSYKEVPLPHQMVLTEN